MKTRAALAALVAASIAIDLVFFTGFLASDDILYTTAARRLVESGRLWPDAAAHEARLLMIGWCALAASFFREDVQAVAASFVVFHQVLIVLTFLLARPLAGAAGGLLAAAFGATFPLLVVFSTTILPDIPATVCLVAAFLTMQAGLRSPPAARRLPLLALSGAAVGLAYLAKESGLVPVPLFVAMALVSGRSSAGPGRRGQGAFACAAAFLTGLLLVVGLETLVLRVLTGSWSFRLAVFFTGSGGNALSLASIAQRTAHLVSTVRPHVWAAAALAAGTLAAAIQARRQPGLVPVLLFPAWYAAYYAWGSAQLLAYEAPSLQARYFIPCVPFLLVAASTVLATVYAWGAERARRVQPLRERALGAAAALVLGIAVVGQLAVCDGSAGNLYGAPLVSQTLRALRSEGPAEDAPIVISETLGSALFPLWRTRPPGLFFSHEVGSRQIERWRDRGGFRFMDLHPTSPLRRAGLNPLIGWPHGLPASSGCVEGLVESLLSGRAIDSGWVMRPAGRFDRVGPRSAEIRALLGDPAALSSLRHRPDRGVIVYHLTGTADDVRYPLAAVAASAAPAVENAAFERWSDAGPVGWRTRDTRADRVPGPGNTEAVRIGPGRFAYLWQSLRAEAALRGRSLTLRADVRSDQRDAARLWVKVAVGDSWEEAFGDPHPGDGAWHPMVAVLPVPPGFAGGEARIALLHARGQGRSEFANVGVDVR